MQMLHHMSLCDDIFFSICSSSQHLKHKSTRVTYTCDHILLDAIEVFADLRRMEQNLKTLNIILKQLSLICETQEEVNTNIALKNYT